MAYITEGGVKYLIRGPYKASDLRQLYKSVVARHPGTKITFREWLVQRGKVHFRVPTKHQ